MVNFVPSVLMDPSEMRNAQNVMWWAGRRARGGSVKVNGTVMTGAPKVRSLFEFVKGSTVNVLAYGGVKIYTLNLSSGALTDKSGSITLASDALLDGVGYNGKFIITDGTNLLASWDGTGSNFVVIADTTAQGVQYLVHHDTRIFGIGKSGDEHRLYWCANWDETDWTTANDAGSILVYPETGGRTTGLISYGGQLYVQKERALFIVDTSPLSLANWKVYKVSDGVGTLSHRCNQQIGMDLVFMSKRGIVSLNRVGEYRLHPLSDVILEDWLNLDKTLSGKWISLADRSRGWYILGYSPAAATEPNKMLVFNVEKGVLEGVWEGVSCTSLLSTEGANFNEVYLAGGSDGYIRKFNELSLNNDDSAAYTASFATPWIPLLVEKGRVFEVTLAELGLFYIPITAEPCNLEVDINIDGKFYKKETFLLESFGTPLGTFQLGIDTLGKDVSLAKTTIGGQGSYVQLVFRSSVVDENFNLYGYYIQYLRSGEY